MRFRSYSMVAILTVMLLLTGFALAQQPAAPATPESAPAAGQQETPPPATSNVQPPPEAPIEPVMSGPYPVMSKAAEDRGRQIFQMFNHAEGGQIWALLNRRLEENGSRAKRNTSSSTRNCASAWDRKRQMLEENISALHLRAGHGVFPSVRLRTLSHPVHHDDDHDQPARSDRRHDHQPGAGRGRRHALPGTPIRPR